MAMVHGPKRASLEEGTPTVSACFSASSTVGKGTLGGLARVADSSARTGARAASTYSEDTSVALG